MLPLQIERSYRLLLTVVLLATLLSALIALTMVRMFTKEATAQTTASEVTHEFRFDESENDIVTGLLTGDNLPQITFRSEVTILDDERSTAEGTKFAVAQVRVAGLIVDAKRNLQTQTVSNGGHGLRITAQQKESMLALCRELESSIGAVGVPAPPEEDLLLRITCYYAEAPVGMKLTDQTIEPLTVSNAETAPEQRTDVATGGVEFVDASLRSDWSSRIGDVPSTEECVQVERLSTAGVLSENLSTRARHAAGQTMTA